MLGSLLLPWGGGKPPGPLDMPPIDATLQLSATALRIAAAGSALQISCTF
jgi:hypothetical protein